VSNKRVINKLRTGKNLEGSSFDPILRYFPSICLQRLRKTTKTSVRIAGLQAKI
jgi:hypothetical protein